MKIILPFVLALFACFETSIAQNYSFAYDAAGNRISRTIPLKSTASSADTLNADLTPVNYNEKIGDLFLTFYPNPVKSEVYLKIDNLDLNQPSELIVVDNSGRMVKTVRNLVEFNTLDFSALTTGYYIVKIRIGTVVTDWKVIKE